LPEDINIETLIQRVDEHISEVIIATNPTIEGETTALYIAKKLQLKEQTLLVLASGLPMGGHLDYADEMTLIKAMEGRKKI
jgi:recombination protein RecR